jgi:phosphoribosylanthranilate isomerase
VKDVVGGTGESFAWDPALMPTEMPVLLAGGLVPDNVGAAIRAMRPHAVDVSSGVEGRVRVKDPALVEDFLAAVRAADEEE